MGDSPATDARKVTKRIKIVLLEKARKKYQRPEDKDPTVYIVRAMEDATRDIELDASELEKVVREIRANEIKAGKVKKGGRHV